jgi:hypothetical protein
MDYGWMIFPAIAHGVVSEGVREDSRKFLAAVVILQLIFDTLAFI